MRNDRDGVIIKWKTIPKLARILKRPRPKSWHNHSWLCGFVDRSTVHDVAANAKNTQPRVAVPLAMPDRYAEILRDPRGGAMTSAGTPDASSFVPGAECSRRK